MASVGAAVNLSITVLGVGAVVMITLRLQLLPSGSWNDSLWTFSPLEGPSHISPAAGTSYCHFSSELGLGAFSGVAVISHYRLGGVRLVLFVQW